MKFDIKNIIVFVCVFLVLILSFKIPNILFEIEDINLTKQVCRIPKKSNTKIDIEAKNIYLIRAIHNMNENYSVDIVSSSKNNGRSTLVEVSSSYIEEAIENEILKMQDYKIFGDLLEDNFSEDFKYVYSVSEKRYMTDDEQYIMKYIYINTKEDDVSIQVESKTNKILSIRFNKNKINQELSKEEVLLNYVKYLDLYIIDDWKFENNALISEKAQLTISMLEGKDLYIIYISTKDSYINYKVTDAPNIEYYSTIDSEN